MKRMRVIIRDKLTGEVLADGSQVEVAETMFVSNHTIRYWIKTGHPRYDIETMEYTVDQEVIDAWDRFCEPIRKKYGIEVRKWN